MKRPTKRTIHLADTGNAQPELMDASNSGPYGVSSPFSMPPYDSLAPIPLPENSPPSCIYPPFTPPGTTVPLPPPAGGGYTPPLPLPPPASTTPTPTLPYPSPPESFPSPTEPGLGPPSPTIYVPSPESPTIYVPSPPSPSIFVPGPPVFEPPVVYPPPMVPPPRGKTPSAGALWCVAKPSVPDPIIQEAMNYACGSGADCDSILPSGSCFQPDTLFAHASYAFNSYWQRTKVAGGSCDFGGTAMLVTVDPSYDGCRFLLF